MIRKIAFIGLTLALVAVLVWLAVQGRKEEVALESETPLEDFRSVAPSALRVIDPRDLEVAQARMELLPPGEMVGTAISHGFSARHHIVIRNGGSVGYGDLLLKLSYLAGNGKELESVTAKASVRLPPGETVSLEEITVEGVPEGAARCIVRILYAELPVAPPAGDSDRR